jgi:hypothetical protein
MSLPGFRPNATLPRLLATSLKGAEAMRTRPTSTLILRLVFAVLFGVMSVVPVPLRALALSAAGQHTPDVTGPNLAHAAGHHGHGAAGHHHGDHLAAVATAGDEPSAPQPVDGTIPCHSAPCCLAVTQLFPSAPETILLLLGQLTVPPAQIIVAVTPDPVVPPPRLQA